MYGVLESQFRKYYDMATNMRGVTGDNLLALCERRLDNVVYRLAFGASRAQARQLVVHGHITVDGKKVDIPSYIVKPGDVIEVKENKKSMQRYKDIVEATNGILVPAWLDADIEELKGTVKELPEREMIDVPVNETLIVELYSK